MQRIQTALIVMQVVVAVLLIAGVLLQTPKSTGLGGTIGGGGDSSLGGGYRTRRGLERQIYYSSWVLAAVFLVVSVTNFWFSVHKP